MKLPTLYFHPPKQQANVRRDLFYFSGQQESAAPFGWLGLFFSGYYIKKIEMKIAEHSRKSEINLKTASNCFYSSTSKTLG